MSTNELKRIAALGRRLRLGTGDALLIVDMQRDYLPGGRVPIKDANEVVPILNRYIEAFALRGLPIFFSRDWHPHNHCSFLPYGGHWPAHCLQETKGAEFPSLLCIPAEAHLSSKGVDANVEAYSAFSDASLTELLRRMHVKRLVVGGLATDYCVRATVLDALALGFKVVLLGDAIRGVDAQAGDSVRALEEMLHHGATISFAPARGPARSRAYRPRRVREAPGKTQRV